MIVYFLTFHYSRCAVCVCIRAYAEKKRKKEDRRVGLRHFVVARTQLRLQTFL